MGGNSSGGSATKIDTKKIQAAANAAITSAFSKQRKGFFFCNIDDLARLEERIASSGNQQLMKTQIFDSSSNLDDITIPVGSILIIFTAETSDDTFLNAVLTRFREDALGIRHVKDSELSLIPSRVSLYRVASVTWKQFLEGLL